MSKLNRFISTKNIIGAALVAAALILLAFVNYLGVAPLKGLGRTGVGNDFGVFWTGARVVMQRESPYDLGQGSAYVEIQEANGDLGDPYQNPVFAALLFIPLACLPLPLAAIIWLTASQVFLVVAIALGQAIGGIVGRAGYLLLGSLFALAFRYTFVSFMVGQMSALILLLLVLSLWAIRSGRQRLAGTLIAISLIKPQLVFLTTPLLLIGPPTRDEVTKRIRWERFKAFAITAGGLIIASLLWLPTWPAGWLERTGDAAMSQATSLSMPSLRGLLATLLKSDPSLLWLVVAALPFWLWLAQHWWHKGREASYDAPLLSIAICITLITAPYTREYEYVLLVFPAMFNLALLGSRKASTTRLAQAAILLLMLVPYVIRANLGRFGAGIEIVVPLAMLVLTLLVARMVPTGERNATSAFAIDLGGKQPRRVSGVLQGKTQRPGQDTSR